MRNTILALLLGIYVLSGHTPAAQADEIIPPCLPFPACLGGGGGGGGPAPHHHHVHLGAHTTANIAAGIAGNVILYIGEAKPMDYVLWNVGSLGGPVGGAGALALLQQDDGLLVNMFTDGFKCRIGDKRDRCAVWVKQHPLKRIRTRHRKKLPLPRIRPN